MLEKFWKVFGKFKTKKVTVTRKISLVILYIFGYLSKAYDKTSTSKENTASGGL